MTETLPKEKASGEPKYYKLRVNINNFKLENVNVQLLVDQKPHTRTTNDLKQTQQGKVQVKITATRTQKISNNQESTNEYVKLYDILPKFNVDANTMRYYMDEKNPLYMIVEFVSNATENIYVNLDDSCESLVETAAKSLLNIKNIEELKHSLENPSESNRTFEEIFPTSILRDLTQSTGTSFTPMKVVENADGSKYVRIDVTVPYAVKSVSLAEKNEADSERSNHLIIKYDGLKLCLDAITSSENSTSTFSKVLKVPKGTLTHKTRFQFDEGKHLLIIEAPCTN